MVVTRHFKGDEKGRLYGVSLPPSENTPYLMRPTPISPCTRASTIRMKLTRVCPGVVWMFALSFCYVCRILE